MKRLTLKTPKEGERKSQWSLVQYSILVMIFLAFFGMLGAHFHVLKTHSANGESLHGLTSSKLDKDTNNPPSLVSRGKVLGEDEIDPTMARIKQLSTEIAAKKQDLLRIDIELQESEDIARLEKERLNLQNVARKEKGENERSAKDLSKTITDPSSSSSSSVSSSTNSQSTNANSDTNTNSGGSSGSNPLPGAAHNKNKPHYILTLSDEEFLSTTVSAMLAPYGESEGGGTCSNDFGNRLVNRWRGVKKEVCSPKDGPSRFHRNSSRAKGILSSQIDCYLVKQTRHHGQGDNLCHMKVCVPQRCAISERPLPLPLAIANPCTNNDPTIIYRTSLSY